MTNEEFCARLDERLGSLATREERLAAGAQMLAEAFRVEPDEVAIFGRERLFGQEVLRFLWPRHLASSASGYVPLSSDSSLAVRTFLDRRPFVNLTFAATHHASYFEILPVERGQKKRPPPIQKIISAPARKEAGFQGVIQVSHKGDSPETAGPDFGEADLGFLTQLAAVIAEHL